MCLKKVKTIDEVRPNSNSSLHQKKNFGNWHEIKYANWIEA